MARPWGCPGQEALRSWAGLAGLEGKFSSSTWRMRTDVHLHSPGPLAPEAPQHGYSRSDQSKKEAGQVCPTVRGAEAPQLEVTPRDRPPLPGSLPMPMGCPLPSVWDG